MSGARVFVSHSHQDNAYCREFVGGLRAKGFAVWYDEHNLGWGALRPTIEREMPQCQHFIAILCPAAAASDWVNAEIDAGLVLLQQGVFRTLTFVVAQPCEVPLLLRRWKRVEGPNGTALTIEAAVTKAVAILTSLPDSPSSSAQHLPLTPQSTLPDRSGRAPTPADARPSRHLMDWPLPLLDFSRWTVKGQDCVLPPICPVPGCVFIMGTDQAIDKGADDETPQHPVHVDDFSIGQHPVTVAEYACAVRSGAVREPRTSGDTDWATQLKNVDHPVVCISWHDALAYTRWLAKLTGQAWRLPTEAEWEKMARWDAAKSHARIYPWGDAFDKARCNTSESDIFVTTPIGRYPSGASPYGAQDAAGNVWEWTSSLHIPYAYNPNDGREDLRSTGDRVLRGGSWFNIAKEARAAFRNNTGPDLHYGKYGFRLALGVS